MDTEARTGSRVLNVVGPRGATYTAIVRKSGLPKGERLDATLRGLVNAGLLVCTVEGEISRFYHRQDAAKLWEQRPAMPVAKRRAIANRQRVVSENGGGFSKHNRIRQDVAAKRYRKFLQFEAEGMTIDDIAWQVNLTPKGVQHVLYRAHKLRDAGRL